MATPVTSSKSMVRRSQVGFPKGSTEGMPDVTAQAMTERVEEMQPRASSKAPIFIALGIVALGGIGGVAYFTMLKQQAANNPPVEVAKKPPAEAPVKAVEPVKPVEPEKPAALALKVQSEPPGAAVELEGRNVGVTPVDVSVERTHLPAVMKLSHDGFEPLTTTVTESSGPLVTMQLVKKAIKHGGKKEPALEIKTGR
jgi:serine/threonine-protein kinase